MPPVVSTTPLVRASDLKRQRGWTEGLIDALLTAPDALAPNPHGFRSPQRFFAMDRILEAERTPQFEAWLARIDEARVWRRSQPTRTYAPAAVERLEWLSDPRRIALFVVPRVPRRRRPRPKPEAAGRGTAAEPARYPLGRFEVLTLF